MSTRAPSLGRGCRAQRGGVGFLFCGEAATSLPSLLGKALPVVILFPHRRVFALMLWGKRYSRIVAFPIGEGGQRQRRSGTFVNCLLETISPALFHPAFPIQPPPLRGTSFHRKEGVSTLAPSLGRGGRAQRGGVGFLFCGEAAFSLPSPRGEGWRYEGNLLSRDLRASPRFVILSGEKRRM